MQIALRGGVTGSLWWPYGAPAWKHLSVDLLREAERCSCNLTEALDSILTAEGGDFQGNARFTADTNIVFTFYHGNRRITRFWALTEFPSLSEIVDAETFAEEFH
jgi:hypothetical protein